MGFIDDWFTSWLKTSKKHEPPIEDLEAIKQPKYKSKPSPKTKSSEEIFKDFEWYRGPIYTNASKGKIDVWERDPNLLKGYKIFSIDETASKADIKIQYHVLAKKYHPNYDQSHMPNKVLST